MKRLRVSLHFKVMFSYLVVVGLVLAPAVLYLQTTMEKELHAAAIGQLSAEAAVLADRLGAAEPGDHSAVARLILAAMPDRVTIVGLDGEVLVDSEVSPDVLDNHGSRPEIVTALASGEGTANRLSKSTKERRLYVARRFPTKGEPRGIVRLSVSVRESDAILRRGSTFMSRAGALALTAAVLLSLLAAFVVSRPLRRLTLAARAFSAGDFGYDPKVSSADELGDAAQALRELAVQLKDTLLSAGSGRATLQTLIDELPIGVILFDRAGHPTLVGGGARRLLDLTGDDEQELVNRIAAMPQQKEALARARKEAKAIAVELRPPWRKERRLTARWLTIWDDEGVERPALILSGNNAEDRLGELSRRLNGTVLLLREAARNLGEAGILSATLEREADALEERSGFARGDGEIVPIHLDELCALATDQVQARAQVRKIRIKVDLPDEVPSVADSGGVSSRAVLALLDSAVRATKKGSRLAVRGEVQNGRVRLSVRIKGDEIDAVRLSNLVEPIGGEAGAQKAGDLTELWVSLPRA